MPKGIANKRYTPEFKKQVVEAVIQDGLSYREAARIYEVQGHGRIESWERIYLEEGPEGLAIERRGRRSTGRPKKQPCKVEEDLLAEVQRLGTALPSARARAWKRRWRARYPPYCSGSPMTRTPPGTGARSSGTA